MPDESEPPYRVEPQADRFAVIDSTGQVLLVCRDAGSAEQYVALLNQAYRRGYKAGYRAGKRPAD